MAAASVNGLNDDPAWRPVPPNVSVLSRSPDTARFTWDSLNPRPPTIARIWPFLGSIATSAPSGSDGLGRCALTAASAARCNPRSREVVTRYPPPKTAAPPYLLMRYRLA